MWSLITVMAFMECSLYTRFGPLHTVVMSMVSNQDAPQPYSMTGDESHRCCASASRCTKPKPWLRSTSE